MSRPDPDVVPLKLVRRVPHDVAALVRMGLLVEHEPGVYRRPRLPARDEVDGEDATADYPTEETP